MDSSIAVDPIDLVYLWCDGNEPEFKRRKNECLGIEEGIKENEEAIGDARFIDNEELKYSLRSLEMYAPWINHVFIVTDRQVPKWLNTTYEKVTVIDHSEIMPKEMIPCFNSSVIEYFLTNIPNLSEKFVYGNDDMFCGGVLAPTDFFENGKPIMRFKAVTRRHLEKDLEKGGYSNSSVCINAILEANNYHNKDCWFVLHHNLDAYTKTIYQNSIEKFKGRIQRTFKNRFRTNDDIQRLLINLDAVYSGEAVLKLVGVNRCKKLLSYLKPLYIDSYAGLDDTDKYQSEIRRFAPKMFCINSGTDCSYERKKKCRDFLDSMFPNKSKFEK